MFMVFPLQATPRVAIPQQLWLDIFVSASHVSMCWNGIVPQIC